MKKYDLMENLGDSQDVINEVVENIENYSYICDGFSEIADSNVDIYNHDLWESAPDFREYIENAILEGLCNGTDLIQAFQSGQYSYYSELIYNNENEIYYNVLENICNELLENEKITKIEYNELIERLDENTIDNNDSGDIFREFVNELIEEIRS